MSLGEALRLACIAGLVTGFCFLLVEWRVGAAQGCPNPPAPTVTSPTLPADVCIPDGFGGNPIKFFDDFSWRAFISMVWPAKQGQRGTPDTAQGLSATGPRVFETLKAEWELFRPGGADPSPWNAFDPSSPCGANPITFNDIVLASFSKFGNLGQAGFGDLVHALPAQNKTWVRYSTGFSKSEYEQIVAGRLYLRSNLDQAAVKFSNGAFDVKASWVDMTGLSNPERYYTRNALLQDPVTGTCTTKLVGLVGLHIVVKTLSRPQWIWSSFEHVDNLHAAPGQRPTFNDGTGAPMPAADPNAGFPPTDWANPKIYNVVRVKPIHSSTQDTNRDYQNLLTGVWKNYALVMTQWPLQLNPPNPIPPAQAGRANATFPGTGATTSFTNTTLETWDQETVNTGCMACHTATQRATDFLWALNTRAFSPPSAIPVAPPAAVQELKKILQSGDRSHRARGRAGRE
jgi:hypothetical protein